MGNNIGIVGYDTNTGVGNIIKWFKAYIPNIHHLIVEHPTIKSRGSSVVPSMVWYKDGVVEDPSLSQISPCLFIENFNIKTLIIIESSPSNALYEIAYKLGVKIFVIPMADAASLSTFKPYLKYIAGFLCPTNWSYNYYCANQTECAVYYLPVPIDTTYFRLSKSGKAAIFLHNQGNGGAHYRKGSDLLYQVFKTLPADYTLWINQQPDLHPNYILPNNLPNVTIHVNEYVRQIDIYKFGQIYLAPSKREGLGLPILEAMSCGLPVITTNAAPMNEWFPKDYPLLVDVEDSFQTQNAKGITMDAPYNIPSLSSLRDKIIWAKGHPDEIKEIGANNRKIIEEHFSWDVLKQTWINTLNGTF